MLSGTRVDIANIGVVRVGVATVHVASMLTASVYVVSVGVARLMRCEASALRGSRRDGRRCGCSIYEGRRCERPR